MKIIEKIKKIVSGTAMTLMIVTMLTPQAASASSEISKPIATPGSGTYHSAQSVSLSLDHNANCTAYTMDGSDPKDSGSRLVYAGVISVDGVNNAVKTLKARSFEDHNCNHNHHYSDLMTATYTFDKQAPVIAAHSDIVAEATSPAGAVVTYTAPNATDNVDPTAPATCAPSSGITFSMGAHTITCNKTDAAGNAATPTTFTITVQDTISPVITLLGANPFSLERGDSFVGVDPGVSVSDITTTTLVTSGIVDTTHVGSYSVTYTATDAGGNAASVARVVDVSDTKKPTVEAGPDVIAKSIFLQVGSVSDAPFEVESVSWNGISGPGTVSFSNPDNESTEITADIDGSYVVRLTAMDEGDPANENSDTFNLIWDTTAPVVTASSLDTNDTTPTVTGTVTDATSGVKSVVVNVNGTDYVATVSPGGAWSADITGALSDGIYNVIATATDNAGNVGVDESTDELKIDTSKPVITLIGEKEITVPVGTDYIDDGSKVTDPDDVLAAITVIPVDMTKTVGDYTITYDVTDPAGNKADQVTRLVHIVEPKVLSLVSVSGDKFVNLSWKNPTNLDLAGLKIYRSTVKGLLGVEIADLLPTSESYHDGSVTNDTTYFYTVVTYDTKVLDGVKRPGIASGQVEGNPKAIVAQVLTAVGAAGAVLGGTGEVLGNTTSNGEVKSNQTGENKEENKQSLQKGLPYFGLFVLLLLLLIGLYLIYLQKPEWFKWLLFWKSKK